MTAPITIEHLVHDYGHGPVLDLHGIEIAAGRVHLVGANGAGKSTLLRILATLTTPTRGHLTVAGARLPDEDRQARERTGYAGHAVSLPGPLTAHEALTLHAELTGRPPREVDQALTAWGLAPHAERPVRDLSHGQARRLDLARAMLDGPRVLLLDEPATGLDADGLATLSRQLDALDPELVLIASPSEPGLPVDRTLTLTDGRLARPEATP